MDTLCVHAGLGPTRPSQSVGAMVAHLIPGMPVAWVTGTPASARASLNRCSWEGQGFPPSQAWMWSRRVPMTPALCGGAHERLHRQVIRDYASRMPLYREERDALEASFLQEAAEMVARYRETSPAERAESLRAFSASCFERAAAAHGALAGSRREHPGAASPAATVLSGMGPV